MRTEHFVDHELCRRVIPGDADPDLARITREVTRYERNERGVIERSVPVEQIERAARRTVPRLEIEDLERPPRLRAEPVDGDRLRVYRPQPSSGGAAGIRPESGRTAREESRDLIPERRTTAIAAPAVPGRPGPSPVSDRS